MKVMTIGGATQDIFIQYHGADTMEITKQFGKQCYTIFAAGEKIEVDEVCTFSGGGATNAAVGFSRMGFQASCFCKVGTDKYGQSIIGELEQYGVQTAHIVTSDEQATGTSFIINAQSGERTIFAYRGANSYLSADEVPLDAIQHHDLIYITSLSNQSSNILHDIVTHAKKKGTMTAINPGISQLRDGTMALRDSLAYIDTLILNSAEAQIFMLALIQADSHYQRTLEAMPPSSNCSPKQPHPIPRLLQNNVQHANMFLSTRNFFKEIFALGTKTVVITDGCYGVYVATPDEILFHPSLSCNVIDTVGAGDAFGSAFVASYYQGDTLEKSLQSGMVNSTSVIGTLGAKSGLLDRSSVNSLAKQVREPIARYSL